jgi:signal transduction histidine kinase
MHSLRTRLLTLWLMLAVSGAVTGFLLIEFYRQSANAQVNRAEETIARSCRDLDASFAFFASGWRGVGASGINDALKRALAGVVASALLRSPGVEGGFWQRDAGSLAYAFPTYEGTGPKTDLPAAELPTIAQVNAAALRDQRPVTARQSGRSQVLLVHACPLRGPIADATSWTMTRVFVGQGPAYNQLLLGLAVLCASVLGSAIWLGRILYSWSRRLGRLEAALSERDPGKAELPALMPTGERELDRLVDALNAAGTHLAAERRRATAAERLAAVGRLAAGLAHEIRNPIAAIRLKAENALAADNDDRRAAALRTILEQVARLDGLLRDLLTMTQRKQVRLAVTDPAAFVKEAVERHRELAAAGGVRLEAGPIDPGPAPPSLDAEQMHRALDNLILNAIQNTAAGGTVTVAALHRDDRLRLQVRDTGPGVPDAIREGLFEPFVTGRADGTGLGLAIVREIARAHGGDAHYKAQPEGSLFEIETPWRPS